MPRRDITVSWVLAASAALLGALGSVATGPGGSHTTWRASAAPSVGLTELDCRIEPAPGGAQRVRLALADGAPLARGTRVAWSTLGNPVPAGGLLRLPRGLAAGDTLAVDTTRAAHAAGCRARAWSGDD